MKVFEDFLVDFLKEKNAESVVKIGVSDGIEMIALLASNCRQLTVVDEPDTARVVEQRYRMISRPANGNVEFIGGYATEVYDLIAKVKQYPSPHADIVFLHRTIINPPGESIASPFLHHSQSNGLKAEQVCARREELEEKFRCARESAYRQFLKLAEPGYIIRFGKMAREAPFLELLKDTLGVDESRISKFEALYCRDPDSGFIIDNT